ncbi:D-glycerate dehydrogenase [Sporosarcina thermotolerans]|uniref:Glyoxylate/hydroxypyruvate reductase B n=1 Tax=Sporosarcina thermotolerans TaxID=633404 RepID=A0AAW9A994_9BACL|nr:D-glycerate dehydrogenase [Sporosarcina thermotolerans]MDW0116211.1 D-glycerate dehydrogenase [Sporosarcina thermotolerans]
MKKKVILYRAIADDLLQILKEQFEVKYHLFASEMTPEFYKDLESAEGLIGNKLSIDRTLLKKAPNLKIVTNISAGYDNLDLNALAERGIMATNTPDVLTDTVADTMFGLILSTARRIPELHNYVRSGQWNEKNIGEELFGVDVHHKTLGIIGMGRIGTAVAEIAHYGFKMDILYNNRSNNAFADEKLHAKNVSLNHLLGESDFVLVLVPLSDSTYKLIGESEFNLMKKSAIFINGSRGEVVDEQALISSLKNKEILAAGLDVYEKEPISKDSPLLSLDNVVTLPHVGSATRDTRYQMAKLAVKNLIMGLNGEVPPSLINREVLTHQGK